MITRRTFASLMGGAVAGMALGTLSGCAVDAGNTANREEEPNESADQGGTEGATSAASPSPLPAGAVCVAEYTGNTLACVNAVDGAVLQRLSAGQNPATLSYGGGFVFVGSSGGGGLWMLLVADATQARFVAAGNQPLGMCFDAERGVMYVGDYFLGCVHVVDVALGSVVGVLELSTVGYRNRTDPPECCRITPGVGRRPVSLALSPKGDMLYCACYGTYDIARIDLSSGTEIEPFDGVVGPRKIVVSRDGEHLFLAGVGGEEDERVGNLYVVDRQSGTRVREVPVGQGVASVSQTSDGTAVLALARNEGVLVAFDASTWEEKGRCVVSLGSDSLALSADGAHAFVANSTTGVLVSVDVATLTVAYEVKGFAGPKDILVVPE